MSQLSFKVLIISALLNDIAKHLHQHQQTTCGIQSCLNKNKLHWNYTSQTTLHKLKHAAFFKNFTKACLKKIKIFRMEFYKMTN